MENVSPRFEKIEGYLLGELKAAERIAFEKELQGDPALAKEVDEHRELFSALRQADEDRLRKRLLQLGKQADRKGKKGKNRGWFMGLAASLLLILIPTWLIFFNSGGEDASFDSQFEAYPDYITGRDGGEADLNQAMAYYNSGEFAQARPFFEKVLAANPKQADALFYLSISELAGDSPEKAASRLQALIHTDSDYKAAAQWYLALAWLKQNKNELLKQQLDLIVNSGSSYAEKARSLAEALD